MKRPWILAVSLALAALLGLSWMLKRSDWLSDQWRLPLEQGLSQASGRTVRIGGVGAALSGWIWLHDVSLGPDPRSRPLDVSLTAKAVGLKVDLMDLLRRRLSVDSLRALQVESPVLYILRDEPPAASPARPGGDGPVDWTQRLKGLPLPPLAMDLLGGQAWEQRKGRAPRLVLEGLGMRVEPRSGGGLRLGAQGRLPGGGALELWARSGPQWGAPAATLRLSQVDLSRLPLFPEAVSVTAGRFSGDLSAEPRAGAWPAGLALKGLGRVEGVAISRSGHPGLEQLRAQWRLQGAQLSLEGVQAQAWDGRLTGQARLDLEARSVSATVALKSAQLAGLMRLAGASDQLGLEGRADMALGVMGPVTDVALSARLSSPAARWQGHPLTGLDLALRLGGGYAQVDGGLDWDAGHGVLSLKAAGGQLQEVNFRATGLPADWLQGLVGTPLEGRLDGEAQYHRGANGGLGPWHISLRAPKVRLRGHDLLKASLQGGGDGKSARLRLDADLPPWPQLSLQAEARRHPDGSWSLSDTRLLQKGRDLVNATGTWRPAISATAQALALTLHSSRVELGQLPLPATLQGYQGTVQADGQLGYEGDHWRGSLRVAAPDLREGAMPLPLSLAVQFGADGVSLTAMNLRHGELKAQLWAPAWQGPWQGRVDLAKAWLPALTRLAPGGPWPLTGTATGRADFDQARREGSVKLELRDPAPQWLPQAQVEMEGRFARGRWDLTALKLTQAGRPVASGDASLDMDLHEAWRGGLQWDGLKLGRGVSSGRIRLEGGQASEGRVVMDPWSWDQRALPPVQAALGFEQGRLARLRLQLGPTARATLTRGDPGWEARVDLEGTDPGPWLGLLHGGAGMTDLRLQGELVAGPWGVTQSAQVHAQLSDQEQAGTRVQWQGHWTSTDGLEGQGSFAGWDLARLGVALRALGWSAPRLKGRLQGQAQAASGACTLSAQVEGLAALGMDFGPAQGQFGWSHGGAWVSHFEAGADGPHFSVDHAQWRPQGGGWRAQGDVKAQALSLAIFDVGLDARVDLKDLGQQGTMRVDALGLKVGVRQWKALALDAGWGKGQWTLRERSRQPALDAQGGYGGGVFSMQVKALSGGGSGTFHGTVGPGDALDLAGDAKGMDAADLAGMMGWDQDWHGSAYGTLTVRGDIGHVRTVVDAKLEDGSVDGLPFDLATGLVRQDGDWVDLAPVGPIRLTRRSGVALEVTGKVPLASPSADGLDVRAVLKQGGLGLFAGIPGIADASGPLALSLRFHGHRDDPQVDGELKVSDGTLTPAWLLPPLEKVEILAQMEDGRVALQEAHAQVQGDGPQVRLELADPGRPAFVFDQWQPAAFNLRLRASASGLPVKSNRNLRFLDGVIHPDLRFGGSWAQPSLAGTVELVKGDADKAVVTWPAVFDPPVADDGGSILNRLKLALVLVARRNVLVRTEAAQAFVDTGAQGLMVGGPPQARTLDGHLVLTQGSVDYLLASFKLATDHESSIDMQGADPPVLDLWGVKDIAGAYLYGDSTPRDVQVRLHAFGPLGKVDMRLESDAQDLSQSQLASLAGLGVDASDPRNQGGFARLLGKVPANFLTRLARRSGVVDEVGVRLPVVEDALAGQQPTPGPVPGELANQGQAASSTATGRSLVEVSVGKYVGENLFLGLNGRVDQRPNQTPGSSELYPAMGGKLEYRLQNNARLSGEYSQNAAGIEEERVMLQRSSSFANYNPERRRWDDSLTAPPSPTPLPQPAATPSATASPGP